MADSGHPPAELHERLLICRTIKLNAGAHGGHRRCCHAQMQKNAQNKPQIARLILCVHTTLQVYCNLFLTFCGGSLKSIDSCMPDLLLSQCILPTVSARSREAPCRLSAPALAYLFSGIFFLVQQVGHIPQADAQGGPVVQQRRGGGRQYPRHTQCDQRQVEAHDKLVAAVDALH